MHYRTTTTLLADSSGKTATSTMTSPTTTTTTTPKGTSLSDSNTTSTDTNHIVSIRRTRSSNNKNNNDTNTPSMTQNSTTTTTGSSCVVDSGNGERITHAPHPSIAVPGHLRRKRIKMNVRHKQQQQRNLFDSYAIWIMIQNFVQQSQRTMHSMKIDVSLIMAIVLWYTLGVVSIASSKVLLTGDTKTSSATTTTTTMMMTMIQVHPLSLTLQQLLIGVSVLRFFLYLQYKNDPTSGLKPWPPPKTFNSSDTNNNPTYTPHSRDHHHHHHVEQRLLQSAVCFTFGFLATNYAFAGSAASFVETIKAAEPITSATVASLYGIETITTEQKWSLTTIIVGVLLSTLGGSSNSNSSSSTTTTTPSSQTMMETLRACMIVMTANLCFSYRGLFQKLFRQHPTSQQYDDLNLQYRMQWYGVLILSVPTFLFDIMPYLLREVLLPKSNEIPTERHLSEVMTSNVLTRYITLSLFNGIAFTCYNLASTWILSRISVVHHAALNCIRRVFAVIVTSLLFGVPITGMGATGIALAVIGFMSYTHYKVKQQQQQQSITGTVSPGQSRNKQNYSLLPLSIQDNHK